MPNYANRLSARHDPKGIPYPGSGGVRDDGRQSHGFMDLKGGEFTVNDVPELVQDPALRAVVEAINVRESGFFSVGCESNPISTEQGHRYSGYVEFALNSRAMVQSAQHYFPVYFLFDRKRPAVC